MAEKIYSVADKCCFLSVLGVADRTVLSVFVFRKKMDTPPYVPVNNSDCGFCPFY